MILPDVNVLIYAFRDDARDHPQYRKWLDSVVSGGSLYGMSPQVLSSVIRICTHRGIFARPSPLDDAFAFCRVLIEQPQCQIIQPGAGHWQIFQNLCRHVRANGNLVQDAWLAALAIENGCEWITTDRHYSLFPGLRWRTPL